MGFYYSLIFHNVHHCHVKMFIIVALKFIVLHVAVSMMANQSCHMANQTSEWLAIWPAVQKNYF